MYEGDAPLAERRAAALSLDRDLLRELLGDRGPPRAAGPRRARRGGAGAAAARRRTARARRRRRARPAARPRARSRPDEIAARTDGDAAAAVDDAARRDGRAIDVRIAGREPPRGGRGRRRGCATRSASRSPPASRPRSPSPTERPLDDLVARYARTHAPVPGRRRRGAVRRRRGPRARGARARSPSAATCSSASSAPAGTSASGATPTCCGGSAAARSRRCGARSSRSTRAAFARFLPAWQGADRPRRGADALTEAVARLQGAAIPASILERDVLPARVRGYRPGRPRRADRQRATSCGSGAARSAPTTAGSRSSSARPRPRSRRRPSPRRTGPPGPAHDAIRAHLRERGASFWPDLVTAAGTADEAAVLRALWDLVWAGEVTNDTFAPLRARRGATRSRRAGGRRRATARRRSARAGRPPGAGRWSLVEPLRAPRPAHRPRSRTPARCSCSTATAW